MSIEIERKYLVENDDWKKLPLIKKIDIEQGYLMTSPDKSVRVRVTSTQAFLTVKVEKPGRGKKISRFEFEQEIPLEEGQTLMKMCKDTLQKTRHVLRDDKNQIWEVDVFKKHLRGLKLAEIELPDEKQQVVLHPWLGKDVSTNAQYTNMYLAKKR